MQTFLPYPDFKLSASVLDRHRLGKQRVECMQIMRILKGQPSRWVNHPAVQMWKGYEGSLLCYTKAICCEWVHVRGYRDTCMEKTSEAFFGEPVDRTRGWQAPPPHWLGNKDFHARHRSKLLAKNPDHYNQFGWVEIPGMPYLWPTKLIL